MYVCKWKEKIIEYLKSNILVTDGAMGTYFASLYDTKEPPEYCNIKDSKKIYDIHRQYIENGAKIIRTNTYACNTFTLNYEIEDVKESIKCACKIAREAAKGHEDIFIAGDIGPITYNHNDMQKQVSDEYVVIAKTMIESGVDAIVFETFPDMDDIKEALKYIAEKGNIFVIVQFAVNQFGYSNSGLSAKKLISDALDCEYTDAAGLNCGVGPGHMYGIFEKLGINTAKYLTALPNAGYPQSVSNRMVFAADNSEYFSIKASDMAERGINIVGGCCGTTPEYIAKLENAVKNMHPVKHFSEEHEKKIMFKPIDKSFYKDKSGKKLIAVELAPPVDSDDEKLMDAAHILKKSGVDVLTFPDSPSGRTRADSILMAEKVHKETGMAVMPHICCRDKNAIAMRSQLLGAHLNDINNFLVITGDPIPSMVRQSVKAVFNFDSVGLMNIIKDMNESQFENSPIVYGGAINQTRRNLDVEISRVRKKMDAGATFFLTQPVFVIKALHV